MSEGLLFVIIGELIWIGALLWMIRIEIREVSRRR